MTKDKLSGPLQESVLTLIATNNKEGAVAANLLSPKVFDEDYRDIAKRILMFRKENGKAPGVEHLDDLLDEVIANREHKKHRTYIRILDGILANAESLNAKYVLSRVSEFNRKQTIKSALIEAADLYQAGGEGFLENVETLLTKAIRPQQNTMDSGTFFNDPKKVLDFLEEPVDFYRLGIPELDHRGVGPTPGELLLYLGPKGSGKSWFCIDVGRKCLMQGAKVLHVTLEMSEKRVIRRYFQNFFAIGKHEGEKFLRASLEKDELGRLVDVRMLRKKVKLGFDNPNITNILKKKMKEWGPRLGRLVIKEFDTRSLTMAKLEAYLDMLEVQYRFVPTVLIVDYPDLMWMDGKDPRFSIRWTFEALRGLLQKRNLAGVAPTQTNRKGWDASIVTGSMVGEDASKLMTADMALIYSRTEMEKERGLARLYVEKNRSDSDGYSLVIAQNYTTGQFVIKSHALSDNYMKLVIPNKKSKETESEE